jgi:hypothetical protein
VLSLVGTTLRLSEYFLNQGTLKVRESSIFSEKFTFPITARAKMSDDGMSTPPSTSKSTIQLNKMREANAKYKSLLKMAKERIQAQEEEIESLRGRIFCRCHSCPLCTASVSAKKTNNTLII